MDKNSSVLSTERVSAVRKLLFVTYLVVIKRIQKEQDVSGDDTNDGTSVCPVWQGMQELTGERVTTCKSLSCPMKY